MVQITMVICTTTKGNVYTTEINTSSMSKVLCTLQKFICTIHPNSIQEAEDDKKAGMFKSVKYHPYKNWEDPHVNAKSHLQNKNYTH